MSGKDNSAIKLASELFPMVFYGLNPHTSLMMAMCRFDAHFLPERKGPGWLAEARRLAAAALAEWEATPVAERRRILDANLEFKLAAA
ncbi:MAG TPA: hypothetical protein VM008_01965 [Phycisphaerae bacterium]|nr:hypothetical protein [Phycisphaerae bacterium]